MLYLQVERGKGFVWSTGELEFTIYCVFLWHIKITAAATPGKRACPKAPVIPGLRNEVQSRLCRTGVLQFLEQYLV